MSPAKMSRIEAVVRTVLDFNKAFNRHDVAAMMAMMADDCLVESAHPAPEGGVYEGKEAVTQFWEDFFRESPEARIDVEDIFGLGWRCVMRWVYRWIDAEGEAQHVRGVDVYLMKGGRIGEVRSYIKG